MIIYFCLIALNPGFKVPPHFSGQVLRGIFLIWGMWAEILDVNGLTNQQAVCVDKWEGSLVIKSFSLICIWSSLG